MLIVTGFGEKRLLACEYHSCTFVTWCHGHIRDVAAAGLEDKYAHQLMTIGRSDNIWDYEVIFTLNILVASLLSKFPSQPTVGRRKLREGIRQTQNGFG